MTNEVMTKTISSFFVIRISSFLRASCFVIPSCFVIRHLSFSIHHVAQHRVFG